MPTIEDLSDRYTNFMIPPGPADPDHCDICWRPCNPSYGRCYACERRPNHLDAMLPITYSIDREQMHTSLRGYKDGWAGDNSDRLKNQLTSQLAAVLTRFVAQHEPCLANAAGVNGFDIVALVPSSTPARWRLRWILETGCAPLAPRFEMLLAPTPIAAGGKTYDPRRYAATRQLAGERVLLVDDTWTRGDSAQSAAAALRAGGADNVAMLVIGRHIDPHWEPIHGSGITNADVLRRAPRFTWNACGYEL